MKALCFVFIISFAVVDILAISTVANATSTKKLRNVTSSKTADRTIATVNNTPMLNINTTETREGKIIQIDIMTNNSEITRPADSVQGTKLNETNVTKVDGANFKKVDKKNESAKESQVQKIHERERKTLKNLFDKILANEHIHLTGYRYDNRGKGTELREYFLVIKKKYVPHNSDHMSVNNLIPNGEMEKLNKMNPFSGRV
ncbi:unnamed protein product, partial [Iphiclides podalirius]